MMYSKMQLNAAKLKKHEPFLDDSFLMNKFLAFLFFFSLNVSQAAEPPPPEPNTSSIKTIEISGHIDDGLDVHLFSEYSTILKSGCLHTPDNVFSHYVEGAGSEAIFRKPLDIVKLGQEYRAVAKPDAFIPGKCDWEFSGVVAVLRTPSGSSSINNWLIVTRRKDYRVEGNSNPHVVYSCKPKELFLFCIHKDRENPFVVYDGNQTLAKIDFYLKVQSPGN